MSLPSWTAQPNTVLIKMRMKVTRGVFNRFMTPPTLKSLVGVKNGSLLDPDLRYVVSMGLFFSRHRPMSRIDYSNTNRFDTNHFELKCLNEEFVPRQCPRIFY